MPFDMSNLAVQSWCLNRTKDNVKVAQMVRDLGLNGIELCGVHCDFNKPETFQGVIDTYRQAGVRIVSIGVEGFGPDEKSARNRFEFAKLAGCKIISANFSPATFLATLPVVYKLIDEYGIKLAIHNHGGYHWLGSGEILDWIFSFTRDGIGLNMDCAWAMDARQDPVQWAQRFAKRLYACHLKDFVFDRARKSTDVVIGTGNLKTEELLKTFQANGFKGECIIEYEGDFDNPLPALKDCVAVVRKAAAAI